MPDAAAPQPPAKNDLKGRQADLIACVELLHRHLTESLCEKVFLENRTVERQRKWTLHAMAQFWVAVTIRAPEALRHALTQAQQGRDALLPHVNAYPEAFFQKCKDFRWTFFAKLYESLTPRLLAEAPCSYASPAEGLRRHFPEIWVMDGSQLCEVVRRLKILWNVRGAVLPGRLFVFYDLFRGVSRALRFEPDAAKNENLLAKEMLASVPEGTLILGDRLFGMPGYFQILAERRCWGVFRRHGTAKVEEVEVLSRKQDGRVLLEDILVRVGNGDRGIPKQTLRLIRYRHGQRALDVFTSVLDREKLPAEKIIELYGLRWSIERMFFDLKEVLNLNRFYAGNPNAIAMQVYAAAMVYNAFRIAQARIAQEHGLIPEKLSSAKLFPKLAVAYSSWVNCELMWEATLEENPDATLRKPGYGRMNFASAPLISLLVEKKTKPRTKGVPNPRCVWLSWKNIPGGDELLRS